MHVAITGASSGIGEALAREYGRYGAKLTLVARREELLRRLAGEIGGDVFVVAHDLSLPDRADAWIASAEAAHGPIDLLVNNAGIENTGPTADADVEEAERVLRTNLHTPLRLMRSLAPAWIARGSGVFVNVASVAALAPTALQAWYGASKAGLAAFSEAFRGELMGTGVQVVTVYPGPVTTPMADRAYAAFGGRKGTVGLMPEGRPDTLARLVRRAVERRKARLIYPRFYVITRLFPWLARWLVDAGAPRPYARERR
jgi:short-subunit dehydrogenase